MNEQKCIACSNQNEDDYDMCKICIQQFIRICTCNKKFITDKPKYYVLGKKNSVITILELPDPIPEFFYTQIVGNLYHILGCRGCQSTEQISVKDNFNAALQASIESCVFQKNENIYEYLSDSLDSAFENYAASQGIVLGEPTTVSFGDTSEPLPIKPIFTN